MPIVFFVFNFNVCHKMNDVLRMYLGNISLLYKVFEILDTMTGICGEILIRLTSPLDHNSSISTKSLNWI